METTKITARLNLFLLLFFVPLFVILASFTLDFIRNNPFYCPPVDPAVLEHLNFFQQCHTIFESPFGLVILITFVFFLAYIVFIVFYLFVNNSIKLEGEYLLYRKSSHLPGYKYFKTLGLIKNSYQDSDLSSGNIFTGDIVAIRINSGTPLNPVKHEIGNLNWRDSVEIYFKLQGKISSFSIPVYLFSNVNPLLKGLITKNPKIIVSYSHTTLQEVFQKTLQEAITDL